MRQLTLFLFWFTACADSPSVPDWGGESVHVDVVLPSRGVADRGRSPAVLGLRSGETWRGTAALVSPRVALTARRVLYDLAREVTCPGGGHVDDAGDATLLELWEGESEGEGRAIAQVQSFVMPRGSSLCDSDMAALVLSTEIKHLAPLTLRRRGAAVGDYLRTVSFTRVSDGHREKTLRDHVPVLATSDWEFSAREDVCEGDFGGVALDERTGEIFGVRAREVSCKTTEPKSIYTRADMYVALVREGEERFLLGPKVSPKAPAIGRKKTATKGPADMGGPCHDGQECAAGICVVEGDAGYCSRTCGPKDRCPAHFRCALKEGAGSVCVKK